MFQSSEIYGGLGSTWDYGPLGVELKRNVKEAWWRSVISGRDDMVGLDAAILMHPRTWEASGHVENFSDPLVECRSCNQRFRQDHLLEARGIDPASPTAAAATRELRCPDCDGEFTEPRRFNLMFRTFMGPVEDTAHEVWLRPETAQGIFVNFKNVRDSSRKKLPFGIGQIGKSFRNEITPGNFTFRTREFEQMEVEFFVHPETDREWLDRWVRDRFEWYVDLGIRVENLRLRQHGPGELAHYAKDCYDIEYRFPWGWAELEGIADRTDFDLKRHAEFSGEDLSYFDDNLKTRFYPYVIEPSGGVDRATLAFWLDAYDEEPDGDAVRVVSRLHRRLAPVTVAVLPAQQKRAADPHRAANPRPPPPALQRPVRRRSGHRSALPQAGRNWYAVLRDRGLRHVGRPPGNGARPRHYVPGPCPRLGTGKRAERQVGAWLVERFVCPTWYRARFVRACTPMLWAAASCTTRSSAPPWMRPLASPARALMRGPW